MVSALPDVSSVLFTKYNLNNKSNLTAQLLSPLAATSQATQANLLSGLQTNSSLVNFIEKNVPNGESLLADLKAIEALDKLYSAESSSNSVYYNSYEQILVSLQQSDDSLYGNDYNPVSLLT